MFSAATYAVENSNFNPLVTGEKIPFCPFQYEKDNHLGNVLVVYSDKRLNVCNADTVTYYRADILQATDYSAFGVILEEREWYVSTDSSLYRMGFNGKEMDSEVSGTGNQYDYGFRIYNPRLGRFLSVDPLTSSYPWYTPYQFAGNTPIAAIDLDGLEEYIVTYNYTTTQGKTVLKITMDFIPPQDRKESSPGAGDANRKADVVRMVNNVQSSANPIPEGGSFDRFSWTKWIDDCPNGNAGCGFTVYSSSGDAANRTNPQVLNLENGDNMWLDPGNQLKAAETEIDISPFDIGYETNSSELALKQDESRELAGLVRYLLAESKATATVTGYVSLTTVNPSALSQDRADQVRDEMLKVARSMRASPEEVKNLNSRINSTGGGTGLAQQNGSKAGSDNAKDRKTIVTINPNE